MSFHLAHQLDFIPRKWMQSGHVQTILGNFLLRTHALPPTDSVLVETVPAQDDLISTQVRCDCHWQPPSVRSQRTTAIVLHGLEGSSESQYVRGNAAKLFSAGCNVIRMNMRNCGGTDRLTPTLYHSGMWYDVDAVMRHFAALYSLQSIVVIGYSMGGNMMLNLAGHLGANTPAYLQACVAISPSIDIDDSATALHTPSNRIYEWNFLNNLTKRFLHKADLFPNLYDPARAQNLHSIRAFDDSITGPYCGFVDAADLYNSVSSIHVIPQITIPTLIIHAKDDPFVHLSRASCHILTSNPNLSLIEPDHGGHCAFLAQSAPGYDGYWAEHMALAFILENTAMKLEPTQIAAGAAC